MLLRNGMRPAVATRIAAVHVALMAILLLATACEKDTWKPKEADRKQIVVHGELMTLHTGTVGTGEHEGHATYVLVDATNPSKLDLAVTLAGSFLDGDGKEVGKIQRQSLRIPAG